MLFRSKFSTLSKEDICGIIKECGQNGVREFKLGALFLNFGPSPAPTIEPVHVAPRVQYEQIKLSEKETEKMARDNQEEELQRLLITDPLEYEQMLRRGDVEDEQREQDEGSED